MRVLVACEESATVREAFRKRGHDAWSCDMQPTRIPGQHIQGDVLPLLELGWDLMVGHPPCTFILNSGCLHLYKDSKRFTVAGENPRDPERWQNMVDGANFFKKLWSAPIKKICLENPIMVKYAQEIIGVKWTQQIHPWQFGHMEMKATCLWLKGLPPLIPTKIVRVPMMELPKKEREKIHYMAAGADRSKARSKTYQGIADAMAEQWG